MWLPLTHPLLGTWPATRHVPWLGIEPATLWITGWHSIHWATPARVVMCNFCVNLTGLQGARILGQTLLWVCLWGVLDEINIWMGRLSKADCPLLRGCLISNPLKTWIEHKTWSSLKQEGTSIAWLYEVRHWSFRPFGLQLKKLTFFRLDPSSFWTGRTPSILLCLHLADYRNWDFSTSIIMWSNSCKTSLSFFLCL